MSVSTREDTSITIQLSGDDGDAHLEQALTYTIVDGPVHGQIIRFDAAAGQVVYLPEADFHGMDGFTFIVTDDGAEALTSQPAVVEIGVTAVNDAPVNIVPEGTFVADEDQPALIQGISVHDVDANEGDGLLEVTLSVHSGTLALTFDETANIAVEGNGSNRVIVVGTEDDINAVLSLGIAYQGAVNYSGTDVLHIVTSDRGNAGEGNLLSDSSEIPITVRSVAEQYVALDSIFVDLVESGQLDGGLGQSLQSKRKPGKVQAELGRLKALMQHVNALVKTGALTPEQGRELTDAADNIRVSLLIGGNSPNAAARAKGRTLPA